jgi:mRNA-degrading endonuclease RelE of RelBE toxin-antitoxin system
MKTFITNRFKRAAKKLHKNQIEILEDVVTKIQANPEIGELKSGDLSNIRVYKFRILQQLILLAYIYEEASHTLTLLSFAPHENFYINLKQQIKS